MGNITAAIKFIEDIRLVGWQDTRSVITDLKDDLPILNPAVQIDMSLLGGIFYGIVDQVGEHLAEADRIT